MKRIILGITGSFGSGKTTVARIFKTYGAKILDADKLAHSCINPGKPAYRKIIKIFGKGILKRRGSINREKLASIVFNNKNLLKRLNNIVHPEVIRLINNQIKLSRSKAIVLDAPLLIESGLDKMVDKLIVVKITKFKQFKRMRTKRRISLKDILKRIQSQMPLGDKVRLADFVIDNSGTIEETKKQAAQIRRLLWKN